MRKQNWLWGMSLLGMLILIGSLASAQSNTLILTVALPDWQLSALSPRVLAGFSEIHPEVKIVPVTLSNDDYYYAFDTSHVSNTLDQAAVYFSRADVVVVRQDTINPLITRAGFVLDLAPYLRADGSGAIEDFYPVGLKTFAWDNSTWALPAALSFNFITYTPSTFDAAGYPYPEPMWGLDQYLEAAQALTLRDASGTVIRPGFYGFDDRAFMRALLGHGFYDDSLPFETPRLSDPDIVAMWALLDAYNKDIEGDDPAATVRNWEWNTIPMQMGGSLRLSEDVIGFEPQTPALFPGDGFSEIGKP